MAGKGKAVASKGTHKMPSGGMMMDKAMPKGMPPKGMGVMGNGMPPKGMPPKGHGPDMMVMLAVKPKGKKGK